ncbi:DUF1353 domain-containing protein [Gimesia panareensis]|uniref:DUF1353 domain-containing protein n=1 Tax=Gimesia panareensis TaxID=2527978 RepID=UPI00118AE7C3|nr:DUF1353 domain-containing protein [Gimesia panareensis]QDU50898.1 hypothetical protein Pan110_32590 [Gimesia panareensis]
MLKYWPTFVAYLLGIVTGIALVASGVLAPAPPEPEVKPDSASQRPPWGEFPVKPRVELMNDGRVLKLVDNFIYIDPHEKVWIAGKDSQVDGASIPEGFWSVTGGPLTGKYRNASIIHDVECERMQEPSEAVHRMFYEACRCGGVDEEQAKVLYAAVYHFGPRWNLLTTHSVINRDGEEIKVSRTVPRVTQKTTKPSEQVMEKLKAFIDKNNPSLDDINRLVPQSLVNE